MSGLEQRSLTRVKAIVSRSSFYRALQHPPARETRRDVRKSTLSAAPWTILPTTTPDADRIAMLNRWRVEIAQLYAGGGPSALTEGLARPVQAFCLRQEDFFSIIDGMEMDVRRDMLAQDWAALELYCDRVASAVGRLSVRIFGIEGEKGRQLVASSRPRSADDKYPSRSR